MTAKKFVPIVLLMFLSTSVIAQDCKLCGTPPRVNLYDFDVQVQEPSDTLGRMKWFALFQIAGPVNSRIFAANKKCVTFLQPIERIAEGKETVTVGMAHAILPPAGDISQYGDYLVTGSITGDGSNYNLNFQLQSSCSREIIFQANYPFELPEWNSSTYDIGQNIANQIPLLSDKINEYSTRKREKDPMVSFSSGDEEQLKIEPKKRTLGVGEETEITITLTDCDGKRLANREINFSKSSIKGFSISGTTGGTVSPSTVTTDNNGKAKAKFKLTDKKNAIIAAHHKFNKPTGCQDAFFGSTPIGAVPVKVIIEYTMSEKSIFDPQVQIGGAKMVGGKEDASFSRTFRTILYNYPVREVQGTVVSVAPDIKNRTTFETLNGNYAYTISKEKTDAQVFLGDQEILEDQMTESEYKSATGSSSLANAPMIVFNTGNNIQPMYFQLEFNFTNEAALGGNATEFPSSVNVSKGDKDARFTVNKINSDQSPYKTEYIILLDRDPGDFSGGEKFGIDMSGIEKYHKISGREYLKVRILSPY